MGVHQRIAAVKLSLFELQEGKCLGCGDPITLDATNRKTYAQLDHDHSCCPGSSQSACGKCYRALLCMGCNCAMGLLKDDPTRITLLAIYAHLTVTMREEGLYHILEET